MTENDILGFDPTSLFNRNNEKPQSQGNSLVYRTRPIDSKSEDGAYRCTIKPIYNPFDFKDSILEQQSYGLQDAQGWFTVISSLTVNDTSCPIFKAWKTCHYAKKEEKPELWKQAAKKEEGGNALFDKRFARYITVQILEDENQPELVGKYMLWKLPKSIYELIISKQNPSVESKKSPIPVMDFLFGRAIELEVIPGPGGPGDERYTRETKYRGELSDDVVSIVAPDGSPLLNDTDQATLDAYVAKASTVWKSKDPEERAKLTAELNADPATVQLRAVYGRVLAEIKKVCPNITEVLGYKEWTPEVAERVNRWIETVLAGNDPATASQAPEAAVFVGNTPATDPIPAAVPTPTTSTAVPEAEDSTDDLPF